MSLPTESPSRLPLVVNPGIAESPSRLPPVVNPGILQYVDDDIRIERGASGEETYVFDPYNSLNRSITKEDVEGILKTYGIQIPIFNLELYRRAFIHKSYIRRPALENEQNCVTIV